MGSSWLSRRNLVLVLVLIKMVTPATIELTGDNVCHRVENYTISVRESYTEPVVVNTFEWCLQIPPRCPKSRVEMRERWRIKAETRQRKVSDCCEGYVVQKVEGKFGELEISDTGECKPHCDICEYGDCVAPNTCKCGPGHQGDGCAYECPSGTWGEKCSRPCNCQSIEICNPVDGKCHCPPGWQGTSCKEKCPPGLWGVDCESPCACGNENYPDNKRLPLVKRELMSHCHHESGTCINLQRVIELPVDEIIMNNHPDRKENIEPSTLSSTTTSLPPSPTKSSTSNPTGILSTNHEVPYGDGDSAEKNDHDPDENRVAEEPGKSSVESLMPGPNHSVSPFEYTEENWSETSSDEFVPVITRIEPSSNEARTGTSKNSNYKLRLRVERIDSEGRVKKPSTPIIMTSLGAEKIPTHAAPMPIDVAALIVIGSIISLGLTTLAVLAIFHIRSKLFETIRLSIYDAEKRDTSNDTIRRAGLEKGNSGRISSTSSNNGILACEYETPRCMNPEHHTLTRPRPPSSTEITKKPESNYSNDYRNIQLFSNLQELLEAHYDRPPSTFRPAVFDIDGEHVYDEIPLQSSTTFTMTKRDT